MCCDTSPMSLSQFARHSNHSCPLSALETGKIFDYRSLTCWTGTLTMVNHKHTLCAWPENLSVERGTRCDLAPAQPECALRAAMSRIAAFTVISSSAPPVSARLYAAVTWPTRLDSVAPEPTKQGSTCSIQPPGIPVGNL